MEARERCEKTQEKEVLQKRKEEGKIKKRDHQ